MAAADDEPMDPRQPGPSPRETFREKGRSSWAWDASGEIYLGILLIVIVGLVIRWYATRASKSEVRGVESHADFMNSSLARRVDALEAIAYANRERERRASA